MNEMKKHIKNLLFRKAKNREEIQMTIVKPEKITQVVNFTCLIGTIHLGCAIKDLWVLGANS